MCKDTVRNLSSASAPQTHTLQPTTLCFNFFLFHTLTLTHTHHLITARSFPTHRELCVLSVQLCFKRVLPSLFLISLLHKSALDLLVIRPPD